MSDFAMPCVHCEYDLSESEPEGVCPECGLAVAESRGVARAWPLRRLKWTRWMLVALAVAALLPLPQWLMTLGHPVFGNVVWLSELSRLTRILAVGGWPAAIAAALFALAARQRGPRQPSARWGWHRWSPCLVIGAIVVTAVLDIGMWIAWLTNRAWLTGAQPSIWVMIAYTLRPIVALVVLLAPYIALVPAAALLRPRWTTAIGLAVVCAAVAAIAQVVMMAGYLVNWRDGALNSVSETIARLGPCLDLIQIMISAAIVIALLPPLRRRERAIRAAIDGVAISSRGPAPSTIPSSD